VKFVKSLASQDFISEVNNPAASLAQQMVAKLYLDLTLHKDGIISFSDFGTAETISY